jgi:hypothetical protein
MKMQEPTLKFAVTCPDCALESLAEIPIAVVANALLTGKSIRLRAGCHDQYWTATFLEREQLRRILATMKTDAVHPPEPIPCKPKSPIRNQPLNPPTNPFFD